MGRDKYIGMIGVIAVREAMDRDCVAKATASEVAAGV